MVHWCNPLRQRQPSGALQSEAASQAMAIHYRVLGAPGKDNALFVAVNRGQRTHRLLFDCGDVGLPALPLADVRAVDHLLLSHLHMDHIGGFDSLFRQNFSRGDHVMHVWGPPETIRIVHHRLRGYLWNLTAHLRGTWVVHDIHPERVTAARFEADEGFAIAHPAGESGRANPLIATADYHVEAVALDHGGATSIGYVLREPPRRNIDSARLAELGLPAGAWLRAVREPHPAEPPSVEVEGRPHRLADLRAALLRESPGGSLAYLSDFRLDAAEIARVAPALRGVATLICEAQYRAADAELAARTAHLTAPLAGALAASAGVDELVIIHVSERYGRPDLPEILAEARGAFANARLPEGWLP